MQVKSTKTINFLTIDAFDEICTIFNSRTTRTLEENSQELQNRVGTVMEYLTEDAILFVPITHEYDTFQLQFEYQ